MPVTKQPREDTTPTWLRYPGVMVRMRVNYEVATRPYHCIVRGSVGVFLGNRPVGLRAIVGHDKRGNLVTRDTKKQLGSPTFFFDGRVVNITLEQVGMLEYVPTEGDGVPRK